MVSEKRVIKTVGYRVTASLLAQLVSWVLFKSITVNLSVLIADLTQMVWYYVYDTLFWWEEKNEPE